jgi:hypothetical protein
MVDAKQLDGISDVRDESDRTGARARGRHTRASLRQWLRAWQPSSVSGQPRMHAAAVCPGVWLAWSTPPPHLYMRPCDLCAPCVHTAWLLPGVRLVVDVKRGFSPQLVLNQLYASTRLQQRFSTNMVRSGGCCVERAR